MNRKSAQSLMDTLWVTLTLALFAYLMHLSSQPDNFPEWFKPVLQQKWASALINIAVSVAAFKFVFGLLSKIYKALLENYVFFRSTSILGKWCYELDISPKPGEAEKRARVGRCEIFIHNGSLKMTGTHWHPGDKMFTANLDTEFIRVNYPQIFIRYVAIGIRQGETDRDYGVFELLADPSKFFSKPKKITGIWTDIFSGDEGGANCGTFKLIRQSEESLSVLKQTGYPIDISAERMVFEQALRQANAARAESKPI